MEETILTDNGELQRLLGYFKQHLRITTDDADVDLRSKLASALSSVGHDVNRVLGSSTVTATAVVSSVSGSICLRLRGPVQRIVSVSVNGVSLPDTDYSIAGNRLQITGDYVDVLVEVVYRAGYVDIPADMWEAVCLRGAGSYANPLDSIMERQRASDVLIRAYRYRDWIS